MLTPSIWVRHDGKVTAGYAIAGLEGAIGITADNSVGRGLHNVVVVPVARVHIREGLGHSYGNSVRIGLLAILRSDLQAHNLVEVQRGLAALNFLASLGVQSHLGVIGHGEGGNQAVQVGAVGHNHGNVVAR